jgi:hypothetical protein
MWGNAHDVEVSNIEQQKERRPLAILRLGGGGWAADVLGADAVHILARLERAQAHARGNSRGRFGGDQRRD